MSRGQGEHPPLYVLHTSPSVPPSPQQCRNLTARAPPPPILGKGKDFPRAGAALLSHFLGAALLSHYLGAALLSTRCPKHTPVDKVRPERDLVDGVDNLRRGARCVRHIVVLDLRSRRLGGGEWVRFEQGGVGRDGRGCGLRAAGEGGEPLSPPHTFMTPVAHSEPSTVPRYHLSLPRGPGCSSYLKG